MSNNGNEIFLAKRRDRLIASILAYKESNVDEYLPDWLAKELRHKILDEINAYHLTVMDALGNKINQDFIDMIAEIHTVIMKEE